MKKIIAVTSVLSVLASASAFAKTEGSYIGLDLHRATVTSNDENLTNPTVATYKQSSKTGLGISYKYAFSFDKFFVAPGVFYERIGTKQYGTEDTVDGATSAPFFSVNNRYGARVDFGYDITSTFAAYVTAGISNTGYKVSLVDSHPTSGPARLENNKNETAMLYGVGFMSKVTDEVSVGAEFNTQRFAVNNRDNSSDIHTKANLDLYKVTLAYHF